tara:strand:- start:950 stop:1228 length:279 start_codon:yes stop_codon:yes gene_type:complete
MRTYKSIAYAYPTSIAAKGFGFGSTGCYYVQQRNSDIEGSGQSITFAAHNGEGYAKANDADLVSFYHETEGEPCPMFLRHGSQDALNAIKEA